MVEARVMVHGQQKVTAQVFRSSVAGHAQGRQQTADSRQQTAPHSESHESVLLFPAQPLSNSLLQHSRRASSHLAFDLPSSSSQIELHTHSNPSTWTGPSYTDSSERSKPHHQSKHLQAFGPFDRGSGRTEPAILQLIPPKLQRSSRYPGK